MSNPTGTRGPFPSDPRLQDNTTDRTASDANVTLRAAYSAGASYDATATETNLKYVVMEHYHANCWETPNITELAKPTATNSMIAGVPVPGVAVSDTLGWQTRARGIYATFNAAMDHIARYRPMLQQRYQVNVNARRVSAGMKSWTVAEALQCTAVWMEGWIHDHPEIKFAHTLTVFLVPDFSMGAGHTISGPLE